MPVWQTCGFLRWHPQMSIDCSLYLRGSFLYSCFVVLNQRFWKLSMSTRFSAIQECAQKNCDRNSNSKHLVIFFRWCQFHPSMSSTVAAMLVIVWHARRAAVFSNLWQSGNPSKGMCFVGKMTNARSLWSCLWEPSPSKKHFALAVRCAFLAVRFEDLTKGCWVLEKA